MFSLDMLFASVASEAGVTVVVLAVSVKLETDCVPNVI